MDSPVRAKDRALARSPAAVPLKRRADMEGARRRSEVPTPAFHPRPGTSGRARARARARGQAAGGSTP